MPWLETDPVTERKRFVVEAQGGLFSHTELCRRHNISRRTGYKWLERYEAEGPDGLLDRSHRPHSCPHATETSRPRPWVVSRACPSGASSSAFCPTSSSPPPLTKTAVTNACTKTSRPRPRYLRPATGVLSSAASMPSELTSTRSGLTRRRVSDLPRPSTSLRLGRCPPSSTCPTTPHTSRPARSPPTAESAGTPPGSTSHTCSAASTSGSRKSQTISGPSTSVPSRSAGYTSKKPSSSTIMALRPVTLDVDLYLLRPLLRSVHF